MGFPASLTKKTKQKKHHIKTQSQPRSLATETTKTYFSTSSRTAKKKMVCVTYLKIQLYVISVIEVKYFNIPISSDSFHINFNSL